MDLEGRSFRRRGNSLVPSDEYSEDFLKGIPEDKEVLVSIRRARSVQHHRYFFKMLSVVVANSDYWQTPDELLDALKLACGHVERRMKIDGTPYIVPKSINFASLDEEQFKRFKDRCIYLLATKVLGCDPEELMKEAA